MAKAQGHKCIHTHTHIHTCQFFIDCGKVKVFAGKVAHCGKVPGKVFGRQDCFGETSFINFFRVHFGEVNMYICISVYACMYVCMHACVMGRQDCCCCFQGSFWRVFRVHFGEFSGFISARYCVCAYVYLCMHVCIYVCMYVCMFV